MSIKWLLFLPVAALAACAGANDVQSTGQALGPTYDGGGGPQYDVGGGPQYDVGGGPQYDVGGGPQYDVGGGPQYDVGVPPCTPDTVICHKGKRTLFICAESVADHLAHGDVPGACP